MAKYRDGFGVFRSTLKVSAKTVVALYESGLSQNAVAQRVGCNPKRVDQILREAGIRRRKKTCSPIPCRAFEARRLYESGLSFRQCSTRLGVSCSTVRYWMRRFGASSRSISEAKHGQRPALHTVEASVRARRKHKLPGRGLVGYKKRADGYIDILVPGRGYVREHRLVIEKTLGRLLKRNEDVHHRNGKRGDNRLENLVVYTSSDHHKEHYPNRLIDSCTGRFLPGERVPWQG